MKRLTLVILCFLMGSCTQEEQPPTLTTERAALYASTLKSATQDEVKVYRDAQGFVHIDAKDADDLYVTLGFVHALDRMYQMEFVRRAAQGRMAELWGTRHPSLIGNDLYARMLRHRERGDSAWEAMNKQGEAAKALLAYSQGINLYLDLWRAEKLKPSGSFGELIDPKQLDPWTPQDSLAVAKLQSAGFTFRPFEEIYKHDLRQAMLQEYNTSSPDEESRARAGLFADLFVHKPIKEITQLPSPTQPVTTTLSTWTTTPSSGVKISPALAQQTQKTAAALSQMRAAHMLLPTRFADHNPSRGSNAWGQKAENESVFIANDPHLEVSFPPIFYPVHLRHQAPNELELVGATFVGMPSVLTGRTNTLAWGVTATHYDLLDVYQEQIEGTASSDTPARVTFKGNIVPLVRRQVEIKQGDGKTITRTQSYTLEEVPHHGPVLPTLGDRGPEPRTSKEAFSFKWTGFEASNEIEAYFAMYRATSPAQAQQALDRYLNGATNFILGWSNGDLLYSAKAHIPIRSPQGLDYNPTTNPSGLAPFFVYPSDGSAEWQGLEPLATLPSSQQPTSSLLIAANNDPTGFSLDGDPTNDPYYLSEFFEPGLRAWRIQNLLQSTNPTTLAQHQAIQLDTFDSLADEMLPHFLEAIELALNEDDTTPNLTRLRAGLTVEHRRQLAQAKDLWARWDRQTPREVDEDSSDNELRQSAAQTLFQVSVVLCLREVFGDELAILRSTRFGTTTRYYQDGAFGIDTRRLVRAMVVLLGNTTMAQTFDPELGDARVFDNRQTPDKETRTTPLVLAILNATQALSGSTPASFPNSSDWRSWHWDNLHGLTIEPSYPDDTSSFVWPQDGTLIPRAGGEFAVNVCDHDLNDLDFSCVYSPVIRLIHELGPRGPRTVWNYPGSAQGTNGTSTNTKDNLQDYEKGRYVEVSSFEQLEQEGRLVWEVK